MYTEQLDLDDLLAETSSNDANMRLSRLAGIWRTAMLVVHGLAASMLLAAENDDDRQALVSFDKFPYPIVRTYVFGSAGTPVGKTQHMNSPFPDDFPPSVIVWLEDAREYPSIPKTRGVYMMAARNVLRVYNISGLTRAPYKTIQPHIEHLQNLLKARPTKVPSGEKHGDRYDELELLPDYPPRNAGHLLQVKMSYLDAPWGSGLFYISQFVQGPGQAPNNEELVYLFQGLSKDQKYFVAADFRITHSKISKSLREVSKASKDADNLTEDIVATLPKQADDSFTPSLRKIRDWVSNLKIE